MKLKFNDFEQYKKAAKGWGFDFVQLDKGPFQGTLRQVSIKNVSVSHFNFNRQFHQQGQILERGRTFAIFLNRFSPMKWMNSTLQGLDAFVVFPIDGALEALTFPGFDAVSISIDQTYLEYVATQNDLSGAYVTIPAHGANYQTDWRVVQHLRSVVRAFLDEFEGPVDGICREEIAAHIARLVLTAFAFRLPQLAPPSYRKRDRAFSAAIDFLRAFPGTPVSVPNLSKLVGASERTLRYAFEERLGISPKQYINACRLRQVRKHLLSSPQGEAPVQEIATRFGYWHAGQFATDYRAMFGERPSETLSRGIS